MMDNGARMAVITQFSEESNNLKQARKKVVIKVEETFAYLGMSVSIIVWNYVTTLLLSRLNGKRPRVKILIKLH